LPLKDHRQRLGELSDGDLVAECASGNDHAWEVLVRRYRRLVCAVPSRAGLDVESVEEVFHATFSKLAERIRSVRDPERIRAWIVTTARRLTIDAIRSKGEARELVDFEGVIAELPGTAELPLEALERIERAHLVRQALQRLDDPCRRLIHLLFYHFSESPPSYESIGKELGIPVGSIGPTRARCLAKLLRELRKIERADS
jgi:RNA polymerase sigma factor (sigma-70 family)